MYENVLIEGGTIGCMQVKDSQPGEHEEAGWEPPQD